MSEVGITENVKGDSRKFEVWCNGREEVYIIQVRLVRVFRQQSHSHTLVPKILMVLCLK